MLNFLKKIYSYGVFRRSYLGGGGALLYLVGV